MNQLVLLRVLLTILILVLFWKIFTENILLILLIVCIIWCTEIHTIPTTETFCEDSMKFPPAGRPVVDLAGNPLLIRPLDDCLLYNYEDCYTSDNYNYIQ